MGGTFAVMRTLEQAPPASAVIVGAGYIGLEMADALTVRGLAVTQMEQLGEVLPTVDPELGALIHAELAGRDVDVLAGTTVRAITRAAPGQPGRLEVQAIAADGSAVTRPADMVLVVAGLRPETALAAGAGAGPGVKGAIAVDPGMRAGLPDVLAAGDCVITRHRLLGVTWLPLGTTAHKQGRVAGENALGGNRQFAGSLGTQVVKIFDQAAARGRFDVDAPFFSVTFARYQRLHPGVTIGYSAVGSSAGIAAFSAGQVDFGASDVPMTARELAAANGGPVTQVPVALGGEGVAYNLSLPAGARLHLTGPVLAAVFLGQITRWNDPALTALNPGVSLPAAAINVVHRSDGSGTTYIFSNYLSSVDPAWAAKVGTGKTLHCPAGEGAEGNGGVAAAVNRTAFSIGYVEQAYSQGLLLPFAAIRNQAGHFAIPSARTVAPGAPKTRHHPRRLLHRQRARRRQLPDQRVQLGAGLHPPENPGHRPGPGHHARLAHPRRPGLRRRQRLRTPPSPDPATRPHHAPAGPWPHRNAPPQLARRRQCCTAGVTARAKPGPVAMMSAAAMTIAMVRTGPEGTLVARVPLTLACRRLPAYGRRPD